MNTDELITRARKAIETGQPNLAQLYMRKALEQTNQQRRELNPIGWQIRQMRKSLTDLAEAIWGAFRPIALEMNRTIAAKSHLDLKLNYALVGPSK